MNLKHLFTNMSDMRKRYALRLAGRCCILVIGILFCILPRGKATLWISVVFALYGLFMLMNRQMTGGGTNAKMMNFGKSRARMQDENSKKSCFFQKIDKKQNKNTTKCQMMI